MALGLQPREPRPETTQGSFSWLELNRNWRALIDAFLAAIRKEMADNIKKTEEKTGSATGEYKAFEIWR